MRWFWREEVVAEAEPDDTDLPLNNDEAAAISNLMDALEKARDLGEKEIAKMCLREARYILKRGNEEPAQIKALPSPQ